MQNNPAPIRKRKPWRMDEQWKPLRDHAIRERNKWLDMELLYLVPDPIKLCIYLHKEKEIVEWCQQEGVEWRVTGIRQPHGKLVCVDIELFKRNLQIGRKFVYPITHDGNMDPLELAIEAFPAAVLEFVAKKDQTPHDENTPTIVQQKVKPPTPKNDGHAPTLISKEDTTPTTNS